MKHSFFTSNFHLLGTSLLVAASIALSSCTTLSDAYLLSRLPDSHPDSAAASARVISKAERKRYAEIDKQVLEEQNKAISDETAAQAYYNTYPSAATFYGRYPRWGRWRGMYYDPLWW